MKLGCACWDFSTDPPYDKSIRLIGEMGFKGISLISFTPQILDEYYTKKKVKSLQKVIESSGLQVIDFTCLSMHKGYWSTEESERKKSLELFKKGVEIAKDLGTKLISIGGGWAEGIAPMEIMRTWRAPIFRVKLQTGADYWTQVWDDTVDTVASCADIAEKNGLRVMLEAHPFQVVSNTDALLRLFDAVCSKSLGACFDTAHARQVGEIEEVSIFKLGNRIFNVHVSDNDGIISDTIHLTPGRGNIDWKGVLKALGMIGYEGFLTVEAGHLGLLDAFEEEINVEEHVRGINLLKEMAKKAGVILESGDAKN